MKGEEQKSLGEEQELWKVVREGCGSQMDIHRTGRGQDHTSTRFRWIGVERRIGKKEGLE